MAGKAAPLTMSSEAMKAIFDNLTSGAGRRAGLEYSINSAAHCKANSFEVSVKSARLSTQSMSQTGQRPNVKTQRSNHGLVSPR